MTISLLPILLTLSISATARTRAVRHPSSFPAPKSVLWIAAHPDDEAVVAPLLSKWCREDGAHCTFVIVTRGDAGACLRSDGCLPDVATVRSSEEGAASQLFHADLILLTLGDGGGVAQPPWALSTDVVADLAHFIEAAHPELILTFDPRHGTTCHPDHRAIAALTLEAVKRLSTPPQVYLLETRVAFTPDPFTINFTSATSAADKFDAASRWNAVIEDMQRHPSQFDARWIAAIQQVPSAERALYIAPADNVMRQGVAECP